MLYDKKMFLIKTAQRKKKMRQNENKAKSVSKKFVKGTMKRKIYTIFQT